MGSYRLQEILSSKPENVFRLVLYEYRYCWLKILHIDSKTCVLYICKISFENIEKKGQRSNSASNSQGDSNGLSRYVTLPGTAFPGGNYIIIEITRLKRSLKHGMRA